MKGYIVYMRDRNRWRLRWWDEKAHKHRNIDKRKGHYMPVTAFVLNKNGQPKLDERGRLVPDKEKCSGYKMAEKLRASIQERWEQAKRGECIFRIEEFTKDSWTDTIEYYAEWLDTFVAKRRKPATVKAYRSYLRNWIEPFFTKHAIRLHEIEYDTLLI